VDLLPQGHRGGFEHDVVELVLQSGELGIDICYEKFDDDRFVAGRFRCLVAEHRDGCRTRDRQDLRGRSGLGKDGAGRVATVPVTVS
jgi:hypothetical protein